MNRRFPQTEHEYTEYDCNNAAVMRLYKNIDIIEYKNICKSLNQYNKIDENRICGTHYSAYRDVDRIIYLIFSESDNSLRIILDPNTNIYQNKESQETAERCKTSLFQFEVDHKLIDCGMCYIIRCCDNSFFIIDSAHTYSVNDYKRIHDFLRSLTENDDKIIISGWFFSHGHVDHIMQFMNFAEENFDDVKIEAVYSNIVSINHKDSGAWMYADKKICIDFEELLQKHIEIPKIKLHTGATFYIRNLKIDVLCTHEDVFPQSLENYNDSSTVILITAENTKMLFPGDAGMIESDILTERYGKMLKCDICQFSHHGHFGTSEVFYNLADADILLFPTTQIMFDNDYESREINRKAISKCKEYYIASNGTIRIDLPYNEGDKIIEYPDETFEDFDGIYNLWGYRYSEERKNELYKEYLKRKDKKIK